ncbi:enoyl-CoA hydratase/isomerase family protein [Thalassospira sp. GO-4]|jgi:methylglutaconyl-CoA hydratase|uniref:enoyl-CoA hydratase/isomerase family protein n=1 Tax=Thalassospira sp. GO-4 TaxID=2946605 RepID=UPI002023DDB8|nr:enoyl-CoA hydratase/isomerase family protein [Thalassospira sp. GO-4]URK19164.1 enoyl-CoA hydratase/isomerase family protein [Thalassospira sp. GO-4]
MTNVNSNNMTDAAICEIAPNGVATITLNRPDIHNAFDDVLIADLTGKIETLDADPLVRVIILTGAGKSFSAGADLNWMKRMAGYSHGENLADSRALAKLMKVLNFASKPTIALVNGAAFGGGVGLAACCDIVIASDRASFCLSEVKLGLIPAVISPYVVEAIGVNQARRYFLSAERFNAETAKQIGLVHEIVAGDELAARGDEMANILLANGPAAMHAAKDLIYAVANKPISDAVIDDTAHRIADQRACDEGREGVGAFLEKRPANWSKK